MKQPPRWTKQEESFLRKRITSFTAHEIGRMLGRSVGGIRTRAHRLGIEFSVTLFDRGLPNKGDKIGDLIYTGQEDRSNGIRKLEMECPHGARHFVFWANLKRQSNTISKYDRKCCSKWNNCPASGCSSEVEYHTVQFHHYAIRNKRSKDHSRYKGMPFFKAWNPEEGGSLYAGYLWIIQQLGKRPKDSTLHIIDHAKGFVPGNLEWTHPQKQSNQQMFRIIAQLKSRIRQLETKLKGKS